MYELKEAIITDLILCMTATFLQLHKTPQLSEIEEVVESKSFH